MIETRTESGSGRCLQIAVVGSGLAGLTATWLLGRQARVTVYEAHARPGMGAHSIRLGPNGSGPLVDVPLRAFTPAYYPTLLSLYREAGVEVAPVDYAASFSRLGGPTYFAYRNARIAGRSIPWIRPASLLDRETRTIARNLLRLHRRGLVDLREGRLKGPSLGTYLESEGYDPAFVEGFLLPAYATVCTCTCDAVRRYPADVILGYFCSGVTTMGVMRAMGGSQDVIDRLLAPAHEVRTGTRVDRISLQEDGVQVADGEGGVRRFDHVILAAPADRGAGLLDGDESLRRILERVPHQSSRIVVHTDTGLAPRSRRAWKPINVIVSDAHDAPMTTIWLNRVQEGLEGASPIFQTWNPVVEPTPSEVVAEAEVSRPVVTVATRDVPKRLASLLDEPGRRIWPVGSYAEEGIPLLEAAAASAARVARRLR